MSRTIATVAGLFAVAFSLGACEAASEGSAKSGDAESSAAATAQAATLTPSGEAQPAPLAVDTDGSLRSAAAAADPVAGNEARLFGIGGEDRAANGLYAYIAFPTRSGSDWAIYELGDIINYTVLSSTAGRVDLDIEETTSINEETGELLSGHRKVTVSWTPGSDGAPPTNVTITPAQ